jgi:ATP:ADP antiporter, AAA family
MPAPETRRSRLERSLARAMRPIAEVRPEEVAMVVVMTLVAFVLMAGYYLLKTAREPLILLQWGAEAKLYAEAGQAFILLGVVRAYGALARRVGRRRLLAIVYLFFASNMVGFALLVRTSLHIGLVFFLWVGIFSYTSIAQFWAFAADMYTEEQGKRLFAVIGVGSSVGSVAGSALARSLVSCGPQVLMFGAAALVSLCVGILTWVDRRADGANLPHAQVEAPVATETPLQLFAHDKYLVLIGALTLALNCVSGLGDYILDRTLLAHLTAVHASGMAAQRFVESFKAIFFAWYNALGVLIQLFAVSRVLKRFGVRTALLVLPVTAFFGYGAFALMPGLDLVRAVVIADRALDYSLTNTARHALFLVASRAEKYVGKTLVDTVGARSGDLASAAAVWLAVRVGVHAAGLAAACAIIACGWVAVVMAIGRENARRGRDGFAQGLQESASDAGSVTALPRKGQNGSEAPNVGVRADRVARRDVPRDPRANVRIRSGH